MTNHKKVTQIPSNHNVTSVKYIFRPLLQVCVHFVKCREHISLLVILCIIVYVTNKANLSSSDMSGKHQQPVLPSWYWCAFTNCARKFSRVKDIWCIVVMLSLIVWSVSIHAFRGRGFERWFAVRGGTFTFSAIRLKLAFSKISYCTFNKSWINTSLHLFFTWSQENAYKYLSNKSTPLNAAGK